MSQFKKDKHGNYKVTLFKGDGIGPEIADSVQRIFVEAGVPISWQEHLIHSKAMTKEGDLIEKEAMDSIVDNGVALKGPFATPIGKGH